MAKAGDKISTKRIWLCQTWALLAKAYGDLTEKVLTEALIESRVPSWDDSGRSIKPEFWRPKPVFAPAKNLARQRAYRITFIGPGTGPVTDSSYPPVCEHHGITLGHAEVRALLPPSVHTTEKLAEEDGPQISRTKEALKKRYPPDGRALGISTKAVRKLIVEDLADDSKKRGLADPSWDTVKRALGRDK
jgi:hypothetical protein